MKSNYLEFIYELLIVFGFIFNNIFFRIASSEEINSGLRSESLRLFKFYSYCSFSIGRINATQSLSF